MEKWKRKERKKVWLARERRGKGFVDKAMRE